MHHLDLQVIDQVATWPAAPGKLTLHSYFDVWVGPSVAGRYVFRNRRRLT
jgi:hypothetical protein